MSVRDSQYSCEFRNFAGGQAIFFHNQGSASREPEDRIHRGQTRRQFRSASKARPITSRLCCRRTDKESAVFLPGKFHSANGAAIYPGRRNSAKKTAVKANIVGLQGGIARFVIQRQSRCSCFCHAHFHHPSIIIATGQKNTGRFRTCIKIGRRDRPGNPDKTRQSHLPPPQVAAYLAGGPTARREHE